MCLNRRGNNISPGQKAARTRKRRAAARKMRETRRRMSVWEKAHATEAASKDAVALPCKRNGWKIAFFEGQRERPESA